MQVAGIQQDNIQPWIAQYVRLNLMKRVGLLCNTNDIDKKNPGIQRQIERKIRKSYIKLSLFDGCLTFQGHSGTDLL